MNDDLRVTRAERFHPTEETTNTNDRRTPTQRDRDRILHSEALRRLANVTQVVDPNEGHVFHNRLTHSLKVAQVARRLAEKLIIDHPQLAQDFCLDPDVAESAALAHDLGHPPFGHVSETELDRLVRARGLDDGYEGNPQSFRILTKLETRGATHPGLDLTRATLNAVLKYPRLREGSGEAHHKWGAYLSEKAVFDWVRQQDVAVVRSLEAELMDWADDIAFSAHDVEDFYRAGLIPTTIFVDGAPQDELNAYLNEVATRWYKNRKNFFDDTPPSEAETFQKLKETFDNFRPLLPFGEPFNNSTQAFASLRNMTSSLIDRYMDVIELNEKALTNPALRKIRFKPEVRDHVMEIHLLKGITWRYVIHNRSLSMQRHGKKRIICDLFDIFSTVLDSEDKEVKYILPEDFEDRLISIEKDLKPYSPDDAREKAKARLAADIISQMNDNEAVLVHKRLMGIDSGSFFQKMPR